MEQQIKEEIKEYMFSFYSGILPICSEERINEIINDTYNHIKDKSYCFDLKGHVSGTGRDEDSLLQKNRTMCVIGL